MAEKGKKKVAKQVEKKEKRNTKSALVLKMAEAGRTRKQIIDRLCEMDPEITRKSNAGLVSHLFTKHELRNKVPSGVERKAKKKVKVKAKKS